MQDSHRQLSFFASNWALTAVIVLTPVLLLAAIPILPTFDDWTSLIAPSFEPLFTKQRFLFYGYHWRPFDSVFGYIVGLNPKLFFPMLNHISVVLAHVACTFLIWTFSTHFQFSSSARNIATFFYFITPSMLATVLAVDGLNQAYASLWGMVSLLLYLKVSVCRKYFLWLFAVVIATLCKENGLMWALITPLVAYAFSKDSHESLTQLKRHLLAGLLLCILYALAILLLPSQITIHPEYVPGILKTVKDFLKFLLTTWITIDYVYLLHAPSRQLLIAVITFLLTLPFFYTLLKGNLKTLISKQFIILLLCQLIAVAPHIFTVFSMMHAYAALPFAALIIGLLADKKKVNSLIPFLLFILSALFINVHLWHESLKSGQIGKNMARQTLSQCITPIHNVFLITIEDDYPRLSSFCVIPSDAFGWGIAAQYENNYKWPEEIRDTIINRTPDALQQAHIIATKKLTSHEADCIWIVNHREVKVVYP